jgi:hypothetical protein
MLAKMWLIALLAGVMPFAAQAQDSSIKNPGHADGLAVYLDIQPAAMAANWQGFHQSTGQQDRTISTVRPDLDRHLVVVVYDDRTGKRVNDASIDVVVSRKEPAGRSFTYTLEKMALGANASYGKVVTMEPSAIYDFKVLIRRAGKSEPVSVPFGPVRVD